MTAPTPRELAAMDDEQRLAVFNTWGEAAFGTSRFVPKFSERSGYSASTVHNWKGRQSPVPVPAVILMMELARGRSTVSIMTEGLEKAGKVFEEAARILSRTVKEAANDLRETDEPPAHADADDAPGVDLSKL